MKLVLRVTNVKAKFHTNPLYNQLMETQESLI